MEANNKKSEKCGVGGMGRKAAGRGGVKFGPNLNRLGPIKRLVKRAEQDNTRERKRESE